jgi:FKBP-type peptidyl-prolyl cis-trans isomerase 2
LDIIPEITTQSINSRSLDLLSLLIRSDGQVFKVKVVDLREDTVTPDANHPLAGATLNVDVELMKLADLSAVKKKDQFERHPIPILTAGNSVLL